MAEEDERERSAVGDGQIAVRRRGERRIDAGGDELAQEGRDEVLEVIGVGLLADGRRRRRRVPDVGLATALDGDGRDAGRVRAGVRVGGVAGSWREVGVDVVGRRRGQRRRREHRCACRRHPHQDHQCDARAAASGALPDHRSPSARAVTLPPHSVPRHAGPYTRAMSRARVVAVAPGSPADLAAVEVGDVLVAINGQPVRDVIQYRVLGDDDEVVLDLDRGGIERVVEIDKPRRRTTRHRGRVRRVRRGPHL